MVRAETLLDGARKSGNRGCRLFFFFKLTVSHDSVKGKFILTREI